MTLAIKINVHKETVDIYSDGKRVEALSIEDAVQFKYDLEFFTSQLESKLEAEKRTAVVVDFAQYKARKMKEALSEHG